MLIYLDCDTGIDDSVALALLLSLPSVTLAGVGTVNGNTTAGQAAINSLGLLSLAGAAVPVAVGGGPFVGEASLVHGANGVGDAVLPSGRSPIADDAPALLSALAAQHPGELHVLAIGPCSNVAAALRRDRDLAGRVASVTVMGGAVRVPGNMNGRAEFNIAADPVAAAEVFAAGWPVTLVPLDLTMRQIWPWSAVAALRENGRPLPEALSRILPAYYDFYVAEAGGAAARSIAREIPLHDPTAAAITAGLIAPADAPVLGLRVDPTDGAIVEDDTAPDRIHVVFDVDRPAGPAILNAILSA
nr:nucleoside hydrolase [uncultured Actinoplanes sp.]